MNMIRSKCKFPHGNKQARKVWNPIQNVRGNSCFVLFSVRFT